MTAPASGFFGKMPSRGDFVRAGLPADLLRGLDGWCQRVLPESRALLGPGWDAAWMEAPPWRFVLAAGCCGAAPVTGAWLASTDRAGRLFPLVIAAAGDGIAAMAGFARSAEAIGLSAIERDVPPERLALAVSEAARPSGPLAIGAGSAWWTEGSRLVAPGRRDFPSMPDGAAFAAMLRDAAGAGTAT